MGESTGFPRWTIPGKGAGAVNWFRTAGQRSKENLLYKVYVILWPTVYLLIFEKIRIIKRR